MIFCTSVSKFVFVFEFMHVFKERQSSAHHRQHLLAKCNQFDRVINEAGSSWTILDPQLLKILVPDQIPTTIWWALEVDIVKSFKETTRHPSMLLEGSEGFFMLGKKQWSDW